MFRFKFYGLNNTNQIEELIKEFLQPSEYEILNSDINENDDHTFVYVYRDDRNELKQKVYDDLSKATGKAPRWGILTGIRPVKLAYELKAKHELDLGDYLRGYYRLSDDKARLTEEIMNYQLETIGRPKAGSLGLYVGIPFCPTRCLYCSFTSNQVKGDEIDRYLEALHKEVEYAGQAALDTGQKLESIYFGGGTPTSLNPDQLDSLLDKVKKSFAIEQVNELKEFTVEAGRPDTITQEKLQVLKEHGVGRISINPQTMKIRTLELIGRAHTVDDVYRAFEIANKVGFGGSAGIINTDLIAGLPEESFEDFQRSLDEILKLGSENITLHTLAVKRASRLKEMDETFNYKEEELRERMLDYAHELLRKRAYKPYYLYRQKHTSGNTENVGFCLRDTVSTYNIRIMEEAQSILALGAGGISKVFFPEENRLERVANVSNYEIYIDRIKEMIERKRKNFFLTYN